MADPIPSLDLRFTPDWLKEAENENRYADYEGETPHDRRERRDSRSRRSGQDRPHRDQREHRGPGSRQSRPGGSQRPRDTAHGQRGPRTEDRSRPRRDEPRQIPEEVEPAAVQVDFLPEERAFTKVIQQIKQGHTAFPLFGLARMFLERPERHRLRIRSLDNNKMLYQLDDHGPLALESVALERIAFSEKRDQFYATEVIEKEPIKGNFTSVARCTLSGRILGPTNYHTFQKNIRSLYDQRFSRRMSFEEYRRTIEIATDPAVVEQWKQEARRVTTFRTKEGESPLAFDDLSGVEQHFRQNYLHLVVKPCLAAEIYGDHVRHLPDRSVIAAIRTARDRENRFPAQMAGALRHGLNQAGLHVFKHKKRILYISTVRPQLFDPNQASLSSGLAAILATLRSYPRITRKQLAEKVLAKIVGEKSRDESSPEYAQAKTNLAADLLWLAKAGHVIEFSDGTLDLPLTPKPEQKETPRTQSTAPLSNPLLAKEPAEEPDAQPATDEPPVTATTPVEQTADSEAAVEITGEQGLGSESQEIQPQEIVATSPELSKPASPATPALSRPVEPQVAEANVPHAPNPASQPEQQRECAAASS